MDEENILRLLKENVQVGLEHSAANQELSAVIARLMAQLSELSNLAETLEDDKKPAVMEMINNYIRKLTQRAQSYVAVLQSLSGQLKGDIDEQKI